MRLVPWKGPDGLMRVMGVPDGLPDSEAPRGILVGPPALDSLGLPPDIEAALHTELYIRGVITLRDVERRPGAVVDAIRAALRIDVPRIASLYREEHDAGVILAPEGDRGTQELPE